MSTKVRDVECIWEPGLCKSICNNLASHRAPREWAIQRRACFVQLRVIHGSVRPLKSNRLQFVHIHTLALSKLQDSIRYASNLSLSVSCRTMGVVRRGCYPLQSNPSKNSEMPQFLGCYWKT